MKKQMYCATRPLQIQNQCFHSGIHLVLRQKQQEKGRKDTRKQISILKSFIVLQKSNYYLTRNKDKWQIFYITNARPAPTGPVFTWHWTTNPPLAFRLLANKPLLTIQRFWFSDLRLENGTLLYIHLQCWSPQSVISGLFEVSISVDPLSSLLHRPPCK